MQTNNTLTPPPKTEPMYPNSGFAQNIHDNLPGKAFKTDSFMGTVRKLIRNTTPDAERSWLDKLNGGSRDPQFFVNEYDLNYSAQFFSNSPILKRFDKCSESHALTTGCFPRVSELAIACICSRPASEQSNSSERILAFNAGPNTSTPTQCTINVISANGEVKNDLPISDTSTPYLGVKTTTELTLGYLKKLAENNAGKFQSYENTSFDSTDAVLPLIAPLISDSNLSDNNSTLSSKTYTVSASCTNTLDNSDCAVAPIESHSCTAEISRVVDGFRRDISTKLTNQFNYLTLTMSSVQQETLKQYAAIISNAINVPLNQLASTLDSETGKFLFSAVLKKPEEAIDMPTIATSSLLSFSHAKSYGLLVAGAGCISYAAKEAWNILAGNETADGTKKKTTSQKVANFTRIISAGALGSLMISSGL